MTRFLRSLCLLTVLLLPGATQVTYQDLVKADPRNWLTYSGSYLSQRYSQLRQIDITNVKNLEMKWVFQAQSLNSFSATPLVVDGVMYLTQAPNDVVALDARTGRTFWIYRYTPAQDRIVSVNLMLVASVEHDAPAGAGSGGAYPDVLCFKAPSAPETNHSAESAIWRHAASELQSRIVIGAGLLLTRE